MNYWKNKVADKLSRILSDSPDSSPSSYHASPPPEAQALLFADDSIDSSSPVTSRSCYESPKSNGRSMNKSDEQRVASSLLRSLSNKLWKSKDFVVEESCLNGGTVCEKEYNFETGLESGTENGRSTAFDGGTNTTRKLELPSSPNKSRSPPEFLKESSFLSDNLYEFLQSAVPNIVKGCQWVLLYSTLRDGISLRTLIRKSSALPGFCLLVIGDIKGAIFGGLLNCPLKPTSKRKYQGTNETFVFTNIYGEPRLFRPTGANRYYYLCLDDILALGGGGNFAIRLDGELLRATSGPCETFGNKCLAHSEEFEVKNIELWGFTHASRYLA